MTTLDLRSDCLVSPTAYDVAVLGAMMLYPQDEAARNRALHATTVTMILENEHHPPPRTPDERRQLFELVRMVPRVTEFGGEIKEGFCRGMVVGGMICDVVFHGTKLGDSKRRLAKNFGFSESLINGVIWPAYKPVAAYWAVYVRINQALVDSPIPCRPHELGQFLAMANDLRCTAETLKRAHTHQLLKPGETVQIPTEIQLPNWPAEGRRVFYNEAPIKL